MSLNSSYFQQVMPKAGTPGVASEGSGGTSSQQSAAPPPGGGLMMLLPLLMIVPILFMSFRRQKKESDQRKTLKKGDRVLTNSGIVGELMEMDERVAKVKIAPGTTVTVVSSMISPYESVPADMKEVRKENDVKDAKALTEKK